MQNKGLKEYLEQVYNLEKSLYELNILYQNVEERIRFLGNCPSQARNRFVKKNGIYITLAVLAGLMVIDRILGAEIGFVIGEWTAGLIAGGIICAALGAAVFFGRGKDVESFNRETEEISNRIILQDERNKVFANKKRTILKKEQNSIIYYRNKIRKTLDELYDCGTVLPQYRNFVAISSVYEYISTGKCTESEGLGGAYEMFEKEIRENTVKSKIDDIIADLDSIRDNQYILYSAIQESNIKAMRITEAIYKLTNRLGDISADAEIVAYKAEIDYKNKNAARCLELYRCK